MHLLSDLDKKFLFQVLRSKDLSLKGEALALLMRNPKTRKQALDKLLNIQSPYGIKNKLIIKHIGIVAKKKLTQAKDHLIDLKERNESLYQCKKIPGHDIA